MIQSITKPAGVRGVEKFASLLLGAIAAIATLASHCALAQTPEADFATRCVGALVCEGFDNASTFVFSQSQSQGLYPPSGSQTLRGFQDTSVKASGASSLRFDILSKSIDDVAGNFSKDFGRTFSQNSTFYVQWQQRFDTNYTTIAWTSMGTAPKQAIMYDRNGFTCANIELTTVDNALNSGVKGEPIVYTECGNRSVRTSLTDSSHFTTAVPYFLQQGSSATSGYNCQYNNENTIGTGNGTGCFKYPANKWITFYYKITVGTWGSANSSIQAWVAMDGQPYREWINVRDYTFLNDGSSSGGWSRIMLTPYMTNKNSSIAHATAQTWYDELIISTLPIPAPGVSSSSMQTPANLRLVR